MLKTISAVLLAVSVLAAPALAASSSKTTQAPVIKAEPVKPGALNANATMGRHHVKHARHHHAYKHIGALKTHKLSTSTIKHAAPATKRG